MDYLAGAVTGVFATLIATGIVAAIRRSRRPLYAAQREEHWADWLEKAAPERGRRTWILPGMVERYKANGYEVMRYGLLRREVRMREVNRADTDYLVMVVLKRQ